MSPRLKALVRLPWLAALLALALPSLALAQAAPAAAPIAPPAAPAAAPDAAPAISPESWAGQLETLSRWLERRRAPGGCAERCFTLDRLRITGAVGEGSLRFELTGGVLAGGPVAVPLFGPPAQVRVESALLVAGSPKAGAEGEPAAIGFEGDHYYLWTGARRFTLRGALSLEGDLALAIPGPLNTLEADITGGAVVEGPRLSGLSGATIHFSRDGGAAAQAAGPTVFQLSRAVRVGREIGFEYRLVMRSGVDLGVVRLPLAFGEEVLDVTGSAGWRAEGGELVLPTSGRTAEMTITGKLARIGAFTPDARSGYEWWLLESDPEHRVFVKGDARQVDSAESPIPRTQATSRLYLVQKGQRIEVSVQPLASVEVLAAVVRGHQRTLVLTERGDLVADDSISYENNGIDYLLYTPGGRPIYLATDAKAERIMHQGEAAAEILVPLQTGSHGVRVQSLAQGAVKALGGAIELPMPSYPLTASRVGLTVGLPERVVPLALLGGDRPAWLADGGDAFALALGFAVGWIAVRPAPDASRGRARGLRALGGLVLAGLWILAPGAYAVALVALATVAAAWLLGRLLQGVRRAAAIVGLLFSASLVGLIVLLAFSSGRSPSSAPYREQAQVSTPAATPPSQRAPGKADLDATGNFFAQTAVGGVLQGVTPVALSLPGYARTVAASRELVTKDRAFRPVLIYVTSTALWPLLLLWIGGAILLVAAHRARIAAAYRRVAERLARKPEGGEAERAAASRVG